MIATEPRSATSTGSVPCDSAGQHEQEHGRVADAQPEDGGHAAQPSDGHHQHREHHRQRAERQPPVVLDPDPHRRTGPRRPRRRRPASTASPAPMPASKAMIGTCTSTVDPPRVTGRVVGELDPGRGARRLHGDAAVGQAVLGQPRAEARLGVDDRAAHDLDAVEGDAATGRCAARRRAATARPCRRRCRPGRGDDDAEHPVRAGRQRRAGAGVVTRRAVRVRHRWAAGRATSAGDGVLEPAAGGDLHAVAGGDLEGGAGLRVATGARGRARPARR